MSRKYQKVSETPPKHEYDKINSDLNGCNERRKPAIAMQICKPQFSNQIINVVSRMESSEEASFYL
jgi:hypothetical protein